MFGSIFMVVNHTLEIAIHILKSANGGLFYTPLYNNTGAGADGKQIHLNELKNKYVEYFIHVNLPSLKRALMGRRGLGKGQSLIETEMACFNPKLFCSESYHQFLRYKEAELLILYYRVRQYFWNPVVFNILKEPFLLIFKRCVEGF